MLEQPHFDDIVIGSSPLMLMQAIRLAQAGRNVRVIDRNKRIGGSWAVAEVQSYNTSLKPGFKNKIFSEIACHVIEVFPGVYEELERISGVPFLPLKEQPIRISPRGLRLRYFIRSLMLAAGVRLFWGWASIRILAFMGIQYGNEARINFDKKLSSFLRYQLPNIFGDTKIYGPRFGYVDFISRLEHRCREAGVTFSVGDVIGMKRIPNGWHLTIQEVSTGLTAKHLHVTTSTNLRLTDPDEFTSTPLHFAMRTAWVVEVAEKHICKLHSYVAFWRYQEITRISRIDSTDVNSLGTIGHVQYLLETRPSPFDLPSRDLSEDPMQYYMERAGIVLPRCPIKIIGRVICKYVYNVDQLPAGEIAPDVWSYFSNGNLAAGVAAWMDNDTIPK